MCVLMLVLLIYTSNFMYKSTLRIFCLLLVRRPPYEVKQKYFVKKVDFYFHEYYWFTDIHCLKYDDFKLEIGALRDCSLTIHNLYVVNWETPQGVSYRYSAMLPRDS